MTRRRRLAYSAARMSRPVDYWLIRGPSQVWLNAMSVAPRPLVTPELPVLQGEAKIAPGASGDES